MQPTKITKKLRLKRPVNWKEGLTLSSNQQGEREAEKSKDNDGNGMDREEKSGEEQTKFKDR